MNEEQCKPYQRIAAAEEQLEHNSLLSLYIELYKKKYRAEPIFPVSNAHLTQIKDLRRAVKEKAYFFISSYFEMRDDWFEKQHYSLDCLLKNLNKVNTYLSSRTERTRDRGKIKLQFHCDACWKGFTLTCDMHFDFLNKPVFCEACGPNAKVKRLNKEERRATVLKLGRAFPDLKDVIGGGENEENRVQVQDL